VWEYLSPRQHHGKLYLELASILGSYMGRCVHGMWTINPIVDPVAPIRWANASTQHCLQVYISMTEDVINALRRDNSTFNEARFRREMAEVSRKYQHIAPHLDDQ